MKRVLFLAALAFLLAACTNDAGGPPRDACALIDDTQAIFGRAVESDTLSPVGEPQHGRCNWRSADGVVSASVQIDVGTPQRPVDQIFAQMIAAMSGMAESGPTAVSDLGDDAQAADLGTQAQIVFRKGDASVLVDARSQDEAAPRGEIAERLARAIVAEL